MRANRRVIVHAAMKVAAASKVNRLTSYLSLTESCASMLAEIPMTDSCIIIDDGRMSALVRGDATKSRGRVMTHVHASWTGLCTRFFLRGRSEFLIHPKL